MASENLKLRKPKLEVESKTLKEPEIETKPEQSNWPHKRIARTVVIFSVLVVVYYTYKQEKIKVFAKQSEILPGRGQQIDCSGEYKKELYEFDGCFPKNCGRFVTDTLISEREADQLLLIAKKGLAFGGSSGGASILDLHSGALSKGNLFINIYKDDKAKDVFTEQDFNVYKIAKMKIMHAVAQHFGIYMDKVYLTHPTFFSKITPKAAVTVHDEYWHPHVDKETYKSFHYTTLLYLNDYNKDFRGGRFFFIDEKYNVTVEPRKARVSMFTSGAENLHHVEKVQSGERYAITISFTCDKKFSIDDPSTTK